MVMSAAKCLLSLFSNLVFGRKLTVEMAFLIRALIIKVKRQLYVLVCYDFGLGSEF